MHHRLESTTTRPLWQCAHVPAFLQNSPFTAKLFRATVEKLARAPPVPTVPVRGQAAPLAELAAAWLHHEATGARLRMAHRCIEWDGWEEGLVDSMLGPEEQEEDWFKEWQDGNCEPVSQGEPADHGWADVDHNYADADGDEDGDGDETADADDVDPAVADRGLGHVRQKLLKIRVARADQR